MPSGAHIVLSGIQLVLAGIGVGLLVAAPIGPVNVLCIQRAVSKGFWGGLAAGLGAVLGDGLIALCAAYWVGTISGALLYHRPTIQIVGGLALIAFGAKLYLSPPRLEALHPDYESRASLKDYAWDIPQTFFLTISNPGAVLGLFAIFGGVSTFVEVRSNIDALTMVASIMGGSLAWWIALSNLIGRFRHRLDATKLGHVNRIAGVLLAGFGLLLVAEMLWKILR